MESNNTLTPFQRMMQLRGVSIRELAGLADESTALICYIARGLAHFPRYEQLERCTKHMGCAPTDIYTKAQLRMMYPERFSQKKENRTRTVHVRIDPGNAEKLKQLYPAKAIASIVNDQRV